MDRTIDPDVVVVGAGAAGCVVAARLAEDRSRSVVLVEAGPDLRGEMSPAFRDGWRISRDLDWGYDSEPRANGEPAKLRRVKAVGGTSLVTRFAVRGSALDFDDWAAAGIAGWSFADVLPWFRKIESDFDFGADEWHGDHGPLPVRRYLESEPTAVVAAVAESAEAAGFAHVDDHNRPNAVGSGRMPMSSRDGTRVTTADAYLGTDVPLRNLTVRGDAHVAAVLLDGTRATGVRLADGTSIHATTTVLCAGVYGSPAILMLSGIGPADDLKRLGGAVAVDLRGVGANLADHPAVDIDLGYGGALPPPPLLHWIGTYRSSSTDSSKPPDMLFWSADPTTEPGVYIDVVLMKPRSRGRVTLRSLDPLDAPRIVLPDVRDERDTSRLVEGLRRAIEIASSPRVRNVCSDPLPDWSKQDVGAAHIAANSYSVPHTVGTCAIGAHPNAGAVVDATGRVHGTESLYVIDASIIPEPPAGFPHIVTIMIAERLADSLRVER